MSAESSFRQGCKVVTASPAQIMSRGKSAVGQCLRLKADAGNTATVWIGNSAAVTAGTNDFTDGWPLAPGEELCLEVNDMLKVWLISGAVQGNKPPSKVRGLAI